MTNEERIRAAWQGRISGCLLGKPVEMISMREGPEGLHSFLKDSGSLPLRDYVKYMDHEMLRGANKKCCLGMMDKAEVDDDITYLVLALMMMEQHGIDLTTDDVARSWINLLPVGATFTAERDSYLKLIEKSNMAYQFGGPRSFDFEEINDGEYNDWIGAQIRIDMYGWVLPGKPKLAAELARRDASLSHRDCAVEASAYIAALCALIPVSSTREAAVLSALELIDSESDAYKAVEIGIQNKNQPATNLHEYYGDMSPVHSLNNLAVVVWAFLSFQDSFDEAIGETICCGWDTDCTGATVGGLLGLAQGSIPSSWTDPWQGRVLTAIAGVGELDLEQLVQRTCTLVDKFSSSTELS
jgi:ADP-ribosylglycohydrolase|tara:strand:- start:2501 stop:3568 length:1068 start_codon:yes stop_codon:yes gene_type:complete